MMVAAVYQHDINWLVCQALRRVQTSEAPSHDDHPLSDALTLGDRTVFTLGS